MKTKAYETLYNVEDSLWWFLALRNLLDFLLKDSKKSMRILDAGCGTGGNIKFLEKYGEVYGLDLSEEAIKYNKLRKNNIVMGSINSLPFKNSSFDVVLASEVIYHQWVNDDKAVKEFNRVLKKGGALLVNTAAYNFMKGKHDEAVMTKKRYTKKSLKELLQRNNFNITKCFYWNSILFPLRLLSVKLNIGNSEESDLDINPMVNKFLVYLMKVEVALIKLGISFPFGLSIICKAEKV